MPTPQEILPALKRAVDAQRELWDAVKELGDLVGTDETDGLLASFATSTEGKELDESDADHFLTSLETMSSDEEDDENDEDEEDEEDSDEYPCNTCGEKVDVNDEYIATPCGTFCDSCMPKHAAECQICREQFGIIP